MAATSEEAVSLARAAGPDIVVIDIRLAGKREQDGPPVSKPAHQGFGSVLLECTVADIGGKVTLDFEPGGITRRMSIPLPALPAEVGSAMPQHLSRDS